MDCRLLIDEPAGGAWNMAVDEALLELAADCGEPMLRLYQWEEPTLSLGYFQAHADRATHASSRNLPCVRRSSGGGALVHDHELTYSLTLPPAAVEGRDTRAMYCAAHRGVISALAALGFDIERLTLCEPTPSSRPAHEPFLCFRRRADGDLLVGPPHPPTVAAEPVADRYKVCGSAQRKRHGALLQHGGVLLSQSDAAPELPGLRELGVGAINAGELAPMLAEKLAAFLDLRCQPGKLREDEHDLANRLIEGKHATKAWIEKR
ncbi:MAG: lipoate--protein ligase family protein [Planctomycetota bacterium]